MQVKDVRRFHGHFENVRPSAITCGANSCTDGAYLSAGESADIIPLVVQLSEAGRAAGRVTVANSLLGESSLSQHFLKGLLPSRASQVNVRCLPPGGDFLPGGYIVIPATENQ